MNSELTTIYSLRRVLESAGEGMGMAHSLVKELRNLHPSGCETARLLLLGHPLNISLRPLTECESEEVSMLASLIVSAPSSSTASIGKNGEAFARTLEGWVRARENGKLEQKVHRFRSMITSVVLGAVTAMIASLGPLVGDLDLTGVTHPSSTALLYGAAGFAAIGSAMLGLFMSGRRFYANAAVSLLAFAAVSYLATPLANVPSIGLWGIK